MSVIINCLIERTVNDCRRYVAATGRVRRLDDEEYWEFETEILIFHYRVRIFQLDIYFPFICSELIIHSTDAVHQWKNATIEEVLPGARRKAGTYRYIGSE